MELNFKFGENDPANVVGYAFVLTNILCLLVVTVNEVLT